MPVGRITINISASNGIRHLRVRHTTLFKNTSDFTQHKRLRVVYQLYIAENEFFDIYEDEHAAWGDDLDAAQMMSGKVIASWKEDVEQLIIPSCTRMNQSSLRGTIGAIF